MPGLEFDECECGRVKPSFINKCGTCRKKPPRPKSRLNNSKSNINNEIYTPKKCLNCKNNAKKGSSLCTPCENIQMGICVKKDCKNQTKKGHKYCGKHANPSTKKGIFVCEICGKKNIGGHIAKGIQKTVGNTIAGVFGGITFLTGGLVAPFSLGVASTGAAISGHAERYSICLDCQKKNS